MLTLRKLLKSLLLTATLALAVPVAFAPLAEAQTVLAQSNGPTLEQAIKQVQRQYGGRIVSANTVVQGGREVHVIRVLTAEGNVKTVRVQGRSRRA
ncbi:MAG: hypothetical protein AAFZ58_14020 [Pseudomonadota bacterium]